VVIAIQSGAIQRGLGGRHLINCFGSGSGLFAEGSAIRDWKGRANLQLLGNSRNRRCAFLLPLSLLMLSMAIFGWGLQYKLSLYQGKSSIAHLTPEAKLLSQKERPLVGQVRSTRPVEPPAFPVFPALLMVTLAASSCQAAARYTRTGSIEKSRAPLPACVHVLFFRPPPVLT
jgi:hypothetical protein